MADNTANLPLDADSLVISQGFGELNASLSDTTAKDLVVQGWSDAHGFATNAYISAINLINGMTAAATSLTNLPNVDPNLSHLTLDISGLTSLLGTLPVAPQNTFVFTEIPYSDTLLTDLKSKLDAWVNGVSTGIDPLVEQAIWDRGRAKEITAGLAKANEAIRSFAMRGHAKPPGALSLEIQDAAQQVINNTVTQARDIAVKQADLEQTNRRFALEQAWKVEEGLLQYTAQVMTRALEYAKQIQQFKDDIYKISVDGYQATTQAYKARVDAEVGIFRAETDQNVAEANIRVEAAKANIQKLIQQAQILIEAFKSGAQSASQLAASALSAVNLSGGIHDSQSIGASISDSRSRSTSAAISGQQSSVYNYTP